jgi:SNF2 family DNA or RNA helicase
MLRLQQVICNWFPYDKELKPIEENNPRLKALSDVLSVIDQKTIIWCRFRADIMAIHNMLKGSCVLYYGDIPNDQRATNIKLFQENPQIKYFVGHAQAGGLGLNLTAAQYAVYYSNSFDLEMRLQSEDRCHRIGTTSNVTYIDLEANNTLDTYIIKALRKKKSLADMVNEDPKCSFLGGDNE